MSRVKLVSIAVLGLLVQTTGAGCDGGGGVGELEFSHVLLVFGDVDPTAGAQTLELEVRNVGSGQVLVYQVLLQDDETSCGTFSLAGGPPWQPIDPGATLRIGVTFTPDASAETGCGCFSSARLSLAFDLDALQVRVPVIASGSCETPLACGSSSIEFPDVMIEFSDEVQVTCVNISQEVLQVESIGTTEATDAVFTVGDRASLPSTLELGAPLDFTVRFAPQEVGDYQGQIVVGGADGAELVGIPISGTAVMQRPECSDEEPPDLEPVLSGDGYTIDLRSERTISYSGVVRAVEFIDDDPPYIAVFVLTSGGYADPGCEIIRSGAAYRVCAEHPGDLFFPVTVLHSSELVDERIRTLQDLDSVTITGYEVEQITLDSGCWVADVESASIMIASWVCDNAE